MVNLFEVVFLLETANEGTSAMNVLFADTRE